MGFVLERPSDAGETYVEIYRPGRTPEIRKDARTVTLDPELPGLTLDLEPIFAT